LNVPDWDSSDVERGRILSVPSAGTEASAVDGMLETPRQPMAGISHDQELLAYLGTGRNRARILIEQQRNPGEDTEVLARMTWLDDTIFARPADRIILRDPSDRHLLGCLTVLAVDPKDSLTNSEYRNWLRERYPVRVRSLVSSQLKQDGAILLDDLADGTPYARSRIEGTIDEEGNLRLLDNGWVVDENWWRVRAEDVLERVERYHEKYPLKPGIPVEEVRSMLPDEGLLDPLVESNHLSSIVHCEEYLRRNDFEPELSSDQEEFLQNLLDELESNRLETPDRSTLEEDCSPEFIDYLVRSGELVSLSEDRLVHREVYENLRQSVREYLEENERARLSELRDHLGSSRKYVIPLMEHLDRDGLTVRNGDYRYLRDSD
jgi:selenocysteine-specific elongation factor